MYFVSRFRSHVVLDLGTPHRTGRQQTQCGGGCLSHVYVHCPVVGQAAIFAFDFFFSFRVENPDLA